MAQIEPPPTYADPVVVDEMTKHASFNPIWLDWFLKVAEYLSAAGAGGGGIDHNSLTGLQGGNSTERYHLTSAQASSMVSGTWTPTLTNTTNLTASTAYSCQYLRIGSTVVCSGKFDADPTAAGSCVLGMSLPVASNFTSANELGGTAFAATVAAEGCAILADATNDRATIQWIAVDTSNLSRYFTFAYRII